MDGVFRWIASDPEGIGHRLKPRKPAVYSTRLKSKYAAPYRAFEPSTPLYRTFCSLILHMEKSCE